MKNIDNIDLKKYASGWMCRNLRNYGNTLVDRVALKTLGVERMEIVLSACLNRPVRLKKTQYERFSDVPVPTAQRGKRKKAIDYIAEVIG